MNHKMTPEQQAALDRVMGKAGYTNREHTAPVPRLEDFVDPAVLADPVKRLNWLHAKVVYADSQRAIGAEAATPTVEQSGPSRAKCTAECKGEGVHDDGQHQIFMAGHTYEFMPDQTYEGVAQGVAVEQSGPLDVEALQEAMERSSGLLGMHFGRGQVPGWEVVAKYVAVEYARLVPQPARPADMALREALKAISDVRPEDAEGTCGPLGVVFDDYMGAHEADDWCHRPKGHTGPHLNIEDWQDFASAALAAQPTSSEQDRP